VVFLVFKHHPNGARPIEAVLNLHYRAIGIGFGHKRSPFNRMPGWDAPSWGYHGDDGKKFHGRGVGLPYGKTYGKGDVVACHIDQSKGTAYFTKNGISQG
jgi:Ran-binding protein 9/10